MGPGLSIHHILQPFSGTSESIPNAIEKSLYEVWLSLYHRLNQFFNHVQSMVSARYNTIITMNKKVRPITLLPSYKFDEPVLDIYPGPFSKDPQSSTPFSVILLLICFGYQI